MLKETLEGLYAQGIHSLETYLNKAARKERLVFLKRMMTTRNVGTFDRIVRALPLIAVAVLWVQGVIGGALAIVLAIVAAMLFVTALTGACSIYYMLGWSTCPISGQPRDKA
jgi:hypothetical protein